MLFLHKQIYAQYILLFLSNSIVLPIFVDVNGMVIMLANPVTKHQLEIEQKK